MWMKHESAIGGWGREGRRQEDGAGRDPFFLSHMTGQAACAGQDPMELPTLGPGSVKGMEDQAMGKIAKILVVDDEEGDRLLMQRVLRSEGYELIQGSNGEEALEKARDAHPDVILLDLRMPKMNGLEVTKRLREDEATRSIPIVIVTGLADHRYRVQALNAGADDFLVKPADEAELKARVRSLIKVKAYHDHLREDRRRLQEEVSKKTYQLQLVLERVKSTSLDTILRLSRVAEYKDEGAGSHIARVSHYAAAVVRRMELAQSLVEGILCAAAMHDVGNVGIPDRILFKPGKLSPDEWDIVKQHTTIGGRILEGPSAGFVQMGCEIALTHHEKWNGEGYPLGLQGSKIPLVGRVTAIADVFDNLTSKRPYKEPYSLETALTIIRNTRGTHFDPDVVDAFLAIPEEIQTIRERHQDDSNV